MQGEKIPGVQPIHRAGRTPDSMCRGTQFANVGLTMIYRRLRQPPGGTDESTRGILEPIVSGTYSRDIGHHGRLYILSHAIGFQRFCHQVPLLPLIALSSGLHWQRRGWPRFTDSTSDVCALARSKPDGTGRVEYAAAPPLVYKTPPLLVHFPSNRRALSSDDSST